MWAYNNFNHQPLRIRLCGMFQFRTASEIIKQFRHWQDSLDGLSARRKASAYTGQYNTERRGKTAMP
jgi:hypothetical protein